MNYYERIWTTLGILCCSMHTFLLRHRFAAWGANSQIEYPAKLVSPHLMVVENKVRICQHAWLNAKDDRGDGKPTLHINEGTHIGRFSQINAWRDVVIGKNVLIADRVFISDADHIYQDLEMPIVLQGDRFKGAIMLMEGCWVGIGSVILPGVTIGKNAIVGANSVVTHSVPDYAIVGGIPAKILKTRNPGENNNENHKSSERIHPSIL